MVLLFLGSLAFADVDRDYRTRAFDLKVDLRDDASARIDFGEVSDR
jgi:hypothetical protein